MRVLSGMGGVGKTSLARAYAQRHLDDYGIVWWIRSEDPAAIDAEYRSLLEILLPPGEATKVADARAVAFAQLARQERPWLLVLDNAPDTAVALPPSGNGHVLITSRASGWPDTTTVRPLGTEAAVELLTSRSGDDDRTAAEALADELGGLPLALTQAAGFVLTTAIDLATYARLYRERSDELLEQGRPPDYPYTVATTWRLAMDKLSAPARELLNLLAFYAPDRIPVYLLRPFDDELTLIRAVGELCSYGLITRAESNTVSVHRLVQVVTRDPASLDRARKLIAPALRGELITAASLARWNALHTHVLALLDHVPPEHPATLSIRYHLAYWTGEAGDAARARDLAAELLPVRERVLGAEATDTLATRHQLAKWTGHAGDAARARDLYAELLPTVERLLGAQHPHTLLLQNELAHWTGEAGDAALARDIYAKLVAIREPALGVEHPDTLMARHNLARWTGDAGEPALARDLYADLLPIVERVRGADHPDTLKAWHNLARWTAEAGDPARARDLFAELLPKRERVLGADHADTLKTRYDLAYRTGEAGNPERARDLLDELLPIRQRVLGAEHPDTVATRDALEYWAGLAGEAEEAGPGGGGEG